ncbi:MULTISPECIES: hypothetical protein [unclassified Streptomyces]|uniref:hypothetical protein n=1 Tax=unclassified Streptomyces TaxID=2593676 RepID=UPI0033BF4711|nr:hypothetical protein OG199_03820 [Streptomyces sp. NBC_01176]
MEELIRDEPNHEFVVSLLENIQNLVSHGLDRFWTPDEVYAQLGPRGAASWDTLADFASQWPIGVPVPARWFRR